MQRRGWQRFSAARVGTETCHGHWQRAGARWAQAQGPGAGRVGAAPQTWLPGPPLSPPPGRQSPMKGCGPAHPHTGGSSRQPCQSWQILAVPGRGPGRAGTKGPPAAWRRLALWPGPGGVGPRRRRARAPPFPAGARAVRGDKGAGASHQDAGGADNSGDGHCSSVAPRGEGLPHIRLAIPRRWHRSRISRLAAASPRAAQSTARQRRSARHVQTCKHMIGGERERRHCMRPLTGSLSPCQEPQR